jgi:5-methylcytosine-specific restriction endonuclease McrA
MPIKPEYHHFYRGKTWQRVRARVLRRSHHTCEGCGVSDNQLYFTRLQDGTIKDGRVVLSVAHLNHNPADNRAENLKALCQRCHLRHDRRLHAQNCRRTWAKKKGLMWLFEEE